MNSLLLINQLESVLCVGGRMAQELKTLINTCERAGNDMREPRKLLHDWDGAQPRTATFYREPVMAPCPTCLRVNTPNGAQCRACQSSE